MAEAGATPVQEIAFTLANAKEYVRAAIASGLAVDEFAPRLSFFFVARTTLLEEVAKFRAARRLWARIMREEFRAPTRKSQMLRFHTQTAGVQLTAQQPEVNLARVTVQALAAVLGGTQSLHTNSYDEAIALPTEKAARLAVRTQQVLAYETDLTATVDPFAGSYAIESMTTDIEAGGRCADRRVAGARRCRGRDRARLPEGRDRAVRLPGSAADRCGRARCRRRQQIRDRRGRALPAASRRSGDRASIRRSGLQRCARIGTGRNSPVASMTSSKPQAVRKTCFTRSARRCGRVPLLVKFVMRSVMSGVCTSHRTFTKCHLLFAYRPHG